MKRMTLAVAATLLLCGAALAQGPEFGQGPGGPPPDFAGGGFPGGAGPRARMRPIRAETLSLRTLVTYLNLSEAQTAKVALAREDAQETMRGPGRPGGAAGDGRAAAAIQAALTAEQKTRLAQLVKAIQALQKAGVRPEAAAKLKLTDAQLAALAQGNAPDEVLTDSQIEVANRNRMPPGGPGGGFPGGPEGGFGGPPPGSPEGGFGGPPPGGPDGEP